ncbi:hypothetical protein KZ483_09030 [Paenibacillus sp. sptzw28]|uniref:hypothetical protein n=1 Tax=Paenibacillus sp. sptzw28 TaxID=715179 RepID=UPI001C6E21A6|nr:hypothetical protein [Paenibacillus sp. sptzw28]QYR23043.1 hypothetical protein KZ483_09030 [Paenibacillus sp. sptzw28]
MIEHIKARFPKGTVKERTDNNRAYIPNQVYTDRIEAATQSRWIREIRDIEVNVPHRFVKVICRVTIRPHSRDGIGFSEIQVDGNGHIKQLSTTVDQATNEAFRKVLDTWQIRWKGLAPFYPKDWGGNPALTHLLDSAPAGESDPTMQSSPMIDRKCIFCNCGTNLT